MVRIQWHLILIIMTVSLQSVTLHILKKNKTILPLHIRHGFRLQVICFIFIFSVSHTLQLGHTTVRSIHTTPRPRPPPPQKKKEKLTFFGIKIPSGTLYPLIRFCFHGRISVGDFLRCNDHFTCMNKMEFTHIIPCDGISTFILGKLTTENHVPDAVMDALHTNQGRLNKCIYEQSVLSPTVGMW